ncbi:MAG TPA: cytochrome c3 family protein [Candidatus Dormibacteraeota bacterium]|jgi:mono/diheme cytochrome c family protein|nr:cytochrome c3 family protein [Candidatus Dormibacteraeota bacterium]
MRIARSAAVGSVAIAAVLIGLLVGFPLTPAKSATAPSAPAGGHAAAKKEGEAHAVDPRIIERGKATYGQYCANCHGDGGKGDGIAGQNLPIKPQNLTEGRVLNPLPDHFFFSVIAHGAQEVGLSPLMPNFKPFLSDVQINEVIAYVRTLADPPYDPKHVLPIATKREGPVQPIFFSHAIHAGSYQIACQYCHANARRSSTAGIPSVERCMGCHKVVAAEGNPEVTKLQGYWDRQEPIPWVRIFKIPEHAQFPHKPHVQAGVQCQTCHGRIEAMERIHAETGQHIVNDLQNLALIPTPPRKLTMGWCVECHRTANVKGVQGVQTASDAPIPSVHVVPGSESERRNAPLECVTCHH